MRLIPCAKIKLFDFFVAEQFLARALELNGTGFQNIGVIRHGKGKICVLLDEQHRQVLFLIDALDDRTADLKRGRYNPFLPTLGGGALTEKQISTVSALLTEELMGIERGLDLLDGSIYPDGMEILKNMLYLGMPAVGKQILCGRTPGKKGEAVTEEL